jgi:hypothetical protein
VSTRDWLRVVGCGGEAGGGGAPVGWDGGHGASAGEGNRAFYSRPMRRLMSSGPREAPREHACQATADGPQGNPGDRTAARCSRRPQHARGVGKGRPWGADPRAVCARGHQGEGTRARGGTGARRRNVRTMCGSRTGGWSLPCVMSD